MAKSRWSSPFNRFLLKAEAIDADDTRIAAKILGVQAKKEKPAKSVSKNSSMEILGAVLGVASVMGVIALYIKKFFEKEESELDPETSSMFEKFKAGFQWVTDFVGSKQESIAAQARQVVGYVEEKTESIAETAKSLVGKEPEKEYVTMSPKEAAEGKQKILDFIGAKESSKYGYNALVYAKKGYETPKSAPLTEMTIAEVFEYQRGMRSRGHASSAVGRYQFIQATLERLVKKAKIPVTEKFSPSVQDRLAGMLLDEAGWNEYKDGKIDTKTFQNRLSRIWASLPRSDGTSEYAGLAGNKVLTSSEKLQGVLTDAKSSTTAVAPKSPSSTTASVQTYTPPPHIPKATKVALTEETIESSNALVPVPPAPRPENNLMRDRKGRIVNISGSG